VAQHTGSQGLVILPLAVVPFNDWGKELLIVRRSDIGDAFCRGCHDLISLEL